VFYPFERRPPRWGDRRELNLMTIQICRLAARPRSTVEHESNCLSGFSKPGAFTERPEIGGREGIEPSFAG